MTISKNVETIYYKVDGGWSTELYASDDSGIQTLGKVDEYTLNPDDIIKQTREYILYKVSGFWHPYYILKPLTKNISADKERTIVYNNTNYKVIQIKGKRFVIEDISAKW